MPSFIKLDFSELPALIAAFAIGPLSGAAVCLLKNLIHMPLSTTMLVGELSNFILGACFVVPAGIIYRLSRTKKGAVLGSFAGALIMAAVSVFSNYYLVYPIYTKFMPLEAILGAYSAIFPGIKNLWQALVIFNMPFTLVKGMLNTVIAMLIYKKLSPVIKGGK